MAKSALTKFDRSQVRLTHWLLTGDADWNTWFHICCLFPFPTIAFCFSCLSQSSSLLAKCSINPWKLTTLPPTVSTESLENVNLSLPLLAVHSVVSSVYGEYGQILIPFPSHSGSINVLQKATHRSWYQTPPSLTEEIFLVCTKIKGMAFSNTAAWTSKNLNADHVVCLMMKGCPLYYRIDRSPAV